MFRVKTPCWMLSAALLLTLSTQSAVGQESSTTWPPSPVPAIQPESTQSSPPLPYNAAWPPPGQDARTFNAGRQDWTAAPEQPAVVSVVPALASEEHLVESTWYFRQDSFYWNERIESRDFVNEYGPLSTLGYVRRIGFERFRMELFGGTVAYDGGAQYDDGTYEPYRQSNGTNYLGFRGEYDLLIEPTSWSRMRAVIGIGTRFWVRGLRDAVTPSGNEVMGYQENWWTFYPYFGIETKESSEPGWKFFGSARFGLTPLTYQHVSYFETTLWPRCGLTGQMELGVRFQKCSVSAYLEAMTWGESPVVRESYQPESRMLTIGGKLSYTF